MLRINDEGRVEHRANTLPQTVRVPSRRRVLSATKQVFEACEKHSPELAEELEVIFRALATRYYQL